MQTEHKHRPSGTRRRPTSLPPRGTAQSLQTCPTGCEIDYTEILSLIKSYAVESMIEFMFEQLPYCWRDAYLAMTPRLTDICCIRLGSFRYYFDDYATLEARGKVPFDPSCEARLVAVVGRSAPQKRPRDDYRLRGWPGKSESHGKKWDRGHFIAHSMGGAVDEWEINVFVQRRDLNRGWSTQGKRYRAMEDYCSQNPRTFCFSRPIYRDNSSRPAILEFGLLKADGKLWVESFDNT